MSEITPFHVEGLTTIEKEVRPMKYIFSNPSVLKELPKLNIETTAINEPNNESIKEFNCVLDNIVSKMIYKEN